MYTESVLLESPTARSGMSHRIEVLDKIKALALSTDGVHATTKEVAEYFEVGEQVVHNLLRRHREELENNGLRVLQGSELQEFVTLKLTVTNVNANSYPQMQRRVAVYTRRTVLNVAMLLRDSDVARRVRAYLLDVESRRRTEPDVAATSASPPAGYASLERRVTNLECAVTDVGSVLRDLGPVIGRISSRLERVDHRLLQMERRQVSTERVVSAMSRRLADMGEDMRTMRADVNRLSRDCARRRPHRRDR
ncbi:hypothetical protein H181DRAFT_01590 [Streptomyces sp. WMMB 714]|uniref:hypothetical protein n=1 Tax=Streptomyces sp. WMMB 714 TaxID=1286822 RepID=UPI0005F80D4F|nr:hypothetical protein [Streptomyces sp. WMMB 714]SCK21814.1 hypothetical protein H181DRAFT_01590 [Streptomyces sp. WMMB 714]